MSRREDERRQGLVRRVPFGSHRLKLQLSDDDMAEFKKHGYVARWINDQDGRIQRAQGGGYVFVKPEEARSLGQGAVHQGSTSTDSRVSKVVSRGDVVVTAFLMKIKEEYYAEDKATKEATNAKVDQALAAGNASGAEVENKYGEGVTYSHS